MVGLEAQAQQVRWPCPECGEIIRLTGLLAARLAERAGRCQGCRARATLERNPGLAGFFLDFWARTGAWPQSDSWLAAVPPSGVSLAGHAYVDNRQQGTLWT